MTATLPEFKQSALIAIEDIRLQGSLDGATGRFRAEREHALAVFPDAEPLRDHFKRLRDATLSDLARHLETFEQQALAAGAHVHWARDGAEASKIVTDLAAARGVRLAAKSKSMATEEIHLNTALERANVKAVETDLGEWIIQLAGEAPSHIIAPAIHKTRQQVADLFAKESGEPQSADDIPALTAAARQMLRAHFLEAGLGISGGNIGVAETGSLVLVTNEGNGRMVTSLPPIHVAVLGIEKIAPTWDDAAAWLALLARSATGQPLSIYTNVITGPARTGDPDGPGEVHIILLDNGRSKLVGTAFEEVLQCIRCGACLNVCPVYREAGGHAYGSPYSGPIGAVISPLLFGREAYEALPQASSLCGACLEVCPARIDLPRMLVALRKEQVQHRIIPFYERWAEQAAARAFGGTRLLRWASGLLRLLQRPFARHGRLRLPGGLHPAGKRDLPALAAKPFREIWQAGLKEGEDDGPR